MDFYQALQAAISVAPTDEIAAELRKFLMLPVEPEGPRAPPFS